MSSSFDPDRDHRSLRRLQARLEAWLQRTDDELFEVCADASGWSPGQHVFHVALANEFSLENVLSLLRQTGALRTEEAEPVAEAEAILQRGRLPRGTQAPRFVTPPRRLQRENLIDVLGGSRENLEAVGERLGELETTPMAIPHQALGPLTAPRWLRFARVHTIHHLELLRRIEVARQGSSQVR